MTALSSPADTERYDGATMALHWLTAFLVIALFALAQTWPFLERGSDERHFLQWTHMSLGVTLAAVIVLRAAWRVTGGDHLPPPYGGVLGLAAKLSHWGLYLLLLAQIVLGFLFAWVGGPIDVFGLFHVPVLIDVGRANVRTVAEIHETVAWIIIVLAGLHALAALVHHYGWRDGVLRRMWPSA